MLCGTTFNGTIDLRYPVRSKIILFTLIPILSVYALLFGFGLTEVRLQSRADTLLRLEERTQTQQLLLARELGILQQQLLELAKDLEQKSPERLQVRLQQWQQNHPQQPNLQLLPAPQGNPAQTARWEALPDHSPGIHLRRAITHNGTTLQLIYPVGPDQLHRLLNRPKFADSQNFLLDAQGNFVFHSAPALIGSNAGLSAEPKLQDLLNNRPQTTYTQYLEQHRDNGRPKLAVITPLQGTPWFLMHLADEARILAHTQERMNQASLLLLLSLGIIVATIVIVSGRTLSPLEDLSTAALAISKGHHGSPLPPAQDDEIGRISGALRMLSKQHQQQLRDAQASQEELQARMNARTRELGEQIDQNERQQHELQLAKDQSEAANRSKSEFLSNMSHELRTPLNGVLGYAQIMQRDPHLNQRQQENLEAIESCGQHLLTLINDVLDLSKIEAGRMQLEISPVDLQRMLKGVYDIVVQRAHAKGLKLHMALADNLPSAINTDPTKLRQILLNLLGNAVKFTEVGSVTLAVEKHEERLRFQVQDTGIGIPDDKIDVIFDAFRQAEAGMVIGGTGLGLAINQRLLELLGGTQLDVSTKLNEGSCFSFTIPLDEADPALVEELDSPLFSDDATLRLEEGQQVDIMVVDDRPENRDILDRLLSDAGFSIETFPDAPSSLQRLKQKDFDLILMDIRMPGMNGLEAAGIIREDPSLKHNKLVAITASVFPEFREQVIDAGFDDFIAKPFRSGELFGVIQQKIGVRYAGEEKGRETDTQTVSPDELPEELAIALAARLSEALELGDVGSLTQDMPELAVPASLQEQIAAYARQFDFASLEALVEQLQNNKS